MRSILLFCAGLFGLAMFPATAQPVPGADPVGLRGDFSGTWFDPEQDGHGLFVEILDRNRAAVAWFTYTPAGEPVWLYGVLAVENHRLTGSLSSARGGRFGPDFDPAAVQFLPWGSITLEASGCDSAVLSWQTPSEGYGSGSQDMVRLTALQGQRCNVEEEFAEQRSFAFERGLNGFEGLFADLPAQGQDIYELDFAYETLPEPLDGRRGLRLSGHNRSDDLAMLIKGPLGGLLPDTLYRLEIEAELASSVPTGCTGIGGSPGDSVYLKLGASTNEPLAVSVTEGNTVMKRLNIDFGNQSEGGANAPVVGTLANSHSCDNGVDAPWELRTVTTRGTQLRARSDADGRLWVFAGSDSAFEGRTDFYFTALRVRLEPAPTQ